MFIRLLFLILIMFASALYAESPSQNIVPGSLVQNTTKAITLYTQSSSAYTPFDTIPAKHTVIAFTKLKGWVSIGDEQTGNIGWVKLTDINKITPPTTQENPEVVLQNFMGNNHTQDIWANALRQKLLKATVSAQETTEHLMNLLPTLPVIMPNTGDNDSATNQIEKNQTSANHE